MSGPTANPHIIVAGTRRSWSPEQKRAILAEAGDPATTASAVARRHGLHNTLGKLASRVAALAEGAAGKVDAAANLADLTSKAEARVNLGLGEVATMGQADIVELVRAALDGKDCTS